MKGFAATFFAILVICAFAAGCESTSGNDGVSRFAWSTYDAPASAEDASRPDHPHPEEGSI